MNESKDVSLKEMLFCLETGKRGKQTDPSKAFLSIGGGHIDNKGLVNWNSPRMKFLSKEFFYSLKKGIIREGDILLVKDGATVGKCA